MRRNRMPDYEVLDDPERHPEDFDPSEDANPSLFDEGSDEWIDTENEGDSGE